VERCWLTFSLLEDTLDGAGAAAAGHCDVELVVVFCHFCILLLAWTVLLRGGRLYRGLMLGPGVCGGSGRDGVVEVLKTRLKL
jgi:hypothetical protein